MNAIFLRMLLGSVVAVCGVCPVPAAGADEAEAKQVTVEQATTAPARLSDAVTVQCSGKEGQFDVTFTVRGKAGRKEHLERDGTFYCVATAPLRVILHERYASDEYRLVVFDLAQSKSKPFYLLHTEPSDYVHLHFAVGSVTKDQITVEEYEYAGSGKPRRRPIVLSSQKSTIAVHRGRWELDDPKDDAVAP